MDEANKGYAALVAYAALAACIGIFVKSISGMGGGEIAFFRASIALIVIFAAALLSGRFRELAPSDYLNTFLVGVFQALNLGLYMFALRSTAVANAVFLMYSAPVFGAVMAWLVLKEKLEKETVAGIIITSIGIALVLDPSRFSFDSSQTIGNVMALASGFFYAAMMIASKPLLERKSDYYVVFWQLVIVCIIASFFINSGSFAAAYQNWWQLAGLGIICTALMYMIFLEGVKRVAAQRVLVINSLEVPLAVGLAAFILGEAPSELTLAGGAIILAGIFIVTRSRNGSKNAKIKNKQKVWWWG